MSVADVRRVLRGMRSAALGAALAMTWIAAGCATPGGPAAQETEAGPLPDRSLTVGDYRERGLPALELAWGAAQLARARALLATLALEDPALLPRWKSTRSGPVFDRILREGILSGELGGDGPQGLLPGYPPSPDPERGLDREQVEIQRAVADASVRVLEESNAAVAEVESWPEAGGAAAARLGKIVEAQRRIRARYDTRLIAALVVLEDFCSTPQVAMVTRAAARDHSLRILGEARSLRQDPSQIDALEAALDATASCRAAGASS